MWDILDGLRKAKDSIRLSLKATDLTSPSNSVSFQVPSWHKEDSIPCDLSYWRVWWTKKISSRPGIT